MYSKIYQRYVNSKKRVADALRTMERGNFYQLLEYDYVDVENSKTWSSSTAPIIFVLYVSAKDDLVHAIKLSDINPLNVKRLFGKLVDEADNELDLGKKASSAYENKIKNMKFFSNNFYRTYKLSGMRRLLSLDMDITNLVPKSKIKHIKDGYAVYSRTNKKRNIDTNKND
jgi:hypothetical protein